MVATKLRVIQSNEMGFPSAVGDQCWSGLKSFTAKEEKTNSTLRKTLFILKRNDGLRDLAVFDSEYDDYRDEDRKYVFKILSIPIVFRDQEMMVHLMSRKDIKLAAVELVEKFGKCFSGDCPYLLMGLRYSFLAADLRPFLPVASAPVARFAS